MGGKTRKWYTPKGQHYIGGCVKLNQCGLKAQHHIAQGSALGILYS